MIRTPSDPHAAIRGSSKRPLPQESLDAYLRRMHDQFGYSRKEVAAKIPTTPKNYMEWRQGKSTPRPNKLPAIARALDVPEEWLTQYAGRRYTTSGPSLQAVLQDERLLRQFIGKPVSRATEAWVLETLRAIEQHLYKSKSITKPTA